MERSTSLTRGSATGDEERDTVSDTEWDVPALASSFRYCRDVTRARAGNFYYTFWLLPRARREAIYAVYTFSRRLDDIVDESPADAGADPRAGLAYMASLLGPDAPAGDPLVPAIQATIARFRIPLRPFHELIAGMEMDLAVRRYETFDDLRLYCYRAAATIGLICVEIFGHGGTETGPAIEAPAIELGLAMQLTNIIRDVGEDVARDRIYLPAAELARFGVSGADLRAGVMTAGMRALLEFQVERARGYFARAEALFPQIDRAARYCPILLKRFYAELLDKVEAAGHDVFRRRVRLSRPRKLYLAGSCWLKSRLWRGADHTSSR